LIAADGSSRIVRVRGYPSIFDSPERVSEAFTLRPEQMVGLVHAIEENQLVDLPWTFHTLPGEPAVAPLPPPGSSNCELHIRMRSRPFDAL
jgi:hypothetical protein